MKKLFALIMVVATLAIAGTAMAADTTLTASRSKFSMKLGDTETITLTATAGHGGTLSAITVAGYSWASVSGSTLTLTPTATGSYNFTAMVTETYSISSDVAGHGSPRVMSQTATLPITVSVVDGTVKVQVITRVVEVVTTVTRTVTVISRTAQGSAVVQTFTETIRTVAQSITVAVLTQVPGFTPRLAEVWTAKSTEVERKRTATLSLIQSNPAQRERAFPGLPTTADLTPRANTSLVAVTSSTRTSMTVAEKLGVATYMLGVDGAKALSVQEAVRATESGTYSFVKTFGSALYGTKIKGHRGHRAKNLAVSSSAFTAAAADNEGVAFINSSGDIVDTIPDASRSQDIMPGYVVMLVVMEAGETYEPLVYATSEDLATAGVSVDRTPLTVSVDQVTETEEKVIVTVNEDGTVEETVITVDEDSADVKAAMAKMATAMGVSSIKVVPASAYTTAVADSVLVADDLLAASNDLHIAARLGFIVSRLSNDAYFMPMTFRELPPGGAVASGATFSFYPDGIVGETIAYSKVFYKNGTEVTNPSAILNGDTYYVAFEILDGGIRVSDTNYTLENPTVTIKMAAQGSQTAVDKIKTIIGSDAVVVAGSYKSTVDTATIAVDDILAASNDLYVVCRPSAYNNLPDGKYIDAVTFSALPSGRSIQSGAGFVFNLDGVDSTAGTVRVFDSTGAEVTTPRSLTGSGYIAFVVSGTAVRASAVTMSNPSVTVKMTSTVTPEYGVGSSSGGCSAGSAVLALALLGTFIASRKK
ncbi:MAG: hypothetical protein IKQ95_10365 [Synergistaceae bacterium]|nr:hypothetical protein [Synergistaceae bacterium]